MTTFTPMRVTLASGALLFVETPAQMAALPADTVFEPTGETDGEGRTCVREVHSAKAMQALVRTIALDLEQAARALFYAAKELKEKGAGKAASQVHLAAQRAEASYRSMTEANG